MTYKYHIYQLKDNMHDKMFISFGMLIKFGLDFDIKDYDEVYSGEIEGGNSDYFVLEDLFELFNIRRPEDFKGHSLSTSDVVVLNGTMYYCDSLGWKKI